MSSYASAVLDAIILSFCPSVTRVLCDKARQCTADILIPHKRATTLVFWHRQWLVGDAPFRLKFALKVIHPFRKTPTLTVKYVSLSWNVIQACMCHVQPVCCISCFGESLYFVLVYCWLSVYCVMSGTVWASTCCNWLCYILNVNGQAKPHDPRAGAGNDTSVNWRPADVSDTR